MVIIKSLKFCIASYINHFSLGLSISTDHFKIKILIELVVLVVLLRDVELFHDATKIFFLVRLLLAQKLVLELDFPAIFESELVQGIEIFVANSISINSLIEFK